MTENVNYSMPEDPVGEFDTIAAATIDAFTTVRQVSEPMMAEAIAGIAAGLTNQQAVVIFRALRFQQIAVQDILIQAVSYLETRRTPVFPFRITAAPPMP